MIGWPAALTAPEHVPGQGAGFVCHGRYTFQPYVGFVNGFGGTAFAVVASPYGAVTVKPLARSCAACLGVATMPCPLAPPPSVTS